MTAKLFNRPVSKTVFPSEALEGPLKPILERGVRLLDGEQPTCIHTVTGGHVVEGTAHMALFLESGEVQLSRKHEAMGASDDDEEDGVDYDGDGDDEEDSDDDDDEEDDDEEDDDADADLPPDEDDESMNEAALGKPIALALANAIAGTSLPRAQKQATADALGSTLDGMFSGFNPKRFTRMALAGVEEGAKIVEGLISEGYTLDEIMRAQGLKRGADTIVGGLVFETWVEMTLDEKAKIGSGGRFKALSSKLKGKVSDPATVAASIGRKKYGKGKFGNLAAKGVQAHGEDDGLDETAQLTRKHYAAIGVCLADLDLTQTYRREVVGAIASALEGTCDQFNRARFVKAAGLAPSAVETPEDDDEMDSEEDTDESLDLVYFRTGVELLTEGGETVARVTCDTENHGESARGIHALIEYANALGYQVESSPARNLDEGDIAEEEILALEWDAVDDLRVDLGLFMEQCEQSELERHRLTLNQIDAAVNEGDFELAEELAEPLLEYKRMSAGARRSRIRSLRVGRPKSVAAGKVSRAEHKRSLMKRRRMYRTSAGTRSKAKRYARRYSRYRARLRPMSSAKSEGTDEATKYPAGATRRQKETHRGQSQLAGDYSRHLTNEIARKRREAEAAKGTKPGPQKRESAEGDTGLKTRTDEAGDKLGVLAGEVMTYLMSRPRTDAAQLQDQFRVSPSCAAAIMGIATQALASNQAGDKGYDGYVVQIGKALAADGAFESEGEHRPPFARGLGEARQGEPFDSHRRKIALATLKMHSIGARIMGGMSHGQAVQYLVKDAGYSLDKVKGLLTKAGHSVEDIARYTADDAADEGADTGPWVFVSWTDEPVGDAKVEHHAVLWKKRATADQIASARAHAKKQNDGRVHFGTAKTTLDEIRAAQAAGKTITSGTPPANESTADLAASLLKIKSGGRTSLSSVGIYAHVWFDGGVGQTDRGDHVPDSGEWQVILSRKEDPLDGSKELGRKEFRYVEGKRRNEIARHAAEWIARQLASRAKSAADESYKDAIRHRSRGWTEAGSDGTRVSNRKPLQEPRTPPTSLVTEAAPTSIYTRLIRETCSCSVEEAYEIEQAMRDMSGGTLDHLGRAEFQRLAKRAQASLREAVDERDMEADTGAVSGICKDIYTKSFDAAQARASGKIPYAQKVEREVDALQRRVKPYGSWAIDAAEQCEHEGQADARAGTERDFAEVWSDATEGSDYAESIIESFGKNLLGKLHSGDPDADEECAHCDTKRSKFAKACENCGSRELKHRDTVDEAKRGKSEGSFSDLPQYVQDYTPEQRDRVVKHLAKKTLAELRKMQSINKAQIRNVSVGGERAGALGNRREEVMASLQAMADIYTDAVMLQQFPESVDEEARVAFGVVDTDDTLVSLWNDQQNALANAREEGNADRSTGYRVKRLTGSALANAIRTLGEPKDYTRQDEGHEEISVGDVVTLGARDRRRYLILSKDQYGKARGHALTGTERGSHFDGFLPEGQKLVKVSTAADAKFSGKMANRLRMKAESMRQMHTQFNYPDIYTGELPFVSQDESLVEGAYTLPVNGTVQHVKPLGGGEHETSEVPALKLDKATIFLPGGMGSWARHEVNDLVIYEAPYAQYTAALHVKFRAKGRRISSGTVLSYKPRIIVFKGWGIDLEPESMMGAEEPGNVPGITVSRSRRSSFDGGWDTEMAKRLGNYTKAKPILSILESEALQAIVVGASGRTGHDVYEAKELPDIDSPTYRDRAKLPKYNVKVSPLSAHGSDGGKMLAGRLPGWTKADHVQAAEEHDRLATKMDDEWKSTAEKAAQETFKRPWRATDYRISGIGSDEFSDSHKDTLRKNAHGASAHRDAAHAHRSAAKLRRVPKANEGLDEARKSYTYSKCEACGERNVHVENGKLKKHSGNPVSGATCPGSGEPAPERRKKLMPPPTKDEGAEGSAKEFGEFDDATFKRFAAADNFLRQELERNGEDEDGRRAIFDARVAGNSAQMRKYRAFKKRNEGVDEAAKSLVKVGDRVCYKKSFLQSTGQYGEAGHARGKVTAIEPLGKGKDPIMLASITWEKGDWPDKVNVMNLSIVSATQGIKDESAAYVDLLNGTYFHAERGILTREKLLQEGVLVEGGRYGSDMPDDEDEESGEEHESLRDATAEEEAVGIPYSAYKAMDEAKRKKGYWRTTKGGHRIFIENGRITKGNPHLMRHARKN